MRSKMKTLGFGAILLAVSAMLSRVLGVVRDMTIAYVFGAGESQGIFALDAYFAAFRVPDLIYTFLVAGAMSAAFVPLYTQYKKQSEEAASAFASQVLHLIAILLIVACLLMWLLAPFFVPLITPGFTQALQDQTVILTRIMLISPFFLGLSSIFQGIENAHKTFWGIALAPLVYNLSLIGGASFFGPSAGVYALTWSVVVGSVLHFLVQWPGVFKTSFRYRWDWRLKSQAVKDFVRLTLPRVFGIGFIQLNSVVDTLLASLLTVGSLSIYNYALNLQSLPHGVVAVSVSIAVFASLSEFDEDKRSFIATLQRSLHAILFWVMPAIIGLYLLRVTLVEVLLQRGAFGPEDTLQTATMLGVFVWASLGQSITPLLARAFYALKDTWTPVLTILVSGLLQVGLSTYFILGLGLPVGALALSALVGASLNAILLMAFMARKLSVPVWSLLPQKSGWNFIHLAVMTSAVLLLQGLTYPNGLIELCVIIPTAGALYLGLHTLTKTTPRSL